MIRVGCGDYTVSVSVGELPVAFGRFIEHAVLHDDLKVPGEDGTLLIVIVGRASTEWPELVSSQRFSPGSEAGFYPGIHLIPESNLLLVGAGTRLLAYDLRSFRRLWEDEANTGFWGWARHGDVVLMSAELELAAWDLQGRKMWSTFVEPPWTYKVLGDRIELDVMGRISSFDAIIGPNAG